MSNLRIYGVREQTVSETAAERAYELLRLQGFCVLDSGLSPLEIEDLRAAFDSAREAYADRYGQDFDLAALGEANILRVLPAIAPQFLKLVEAPLLQAVLHLAFGGSVTLNQVNGLINPPSPDAPPLRWHRDLPYQHYVASRPLALNALFCLDDFTVENGATQVAPGTHKEEKCPSEAVLLQIATPAPAPAGSFLVLDSMLFHTGGENLTDSPRRGVNHVFTIPPFRQQISLESALAGQTSVPPHLQRLLGFSSTEPRSVEEWLESRRARLGAN